MTYDLISLWRKHRQRHPASNFDFAIPDYVTTIIYPDGSIKKTMMVNKDLIERLAKKPVQEEQVEQEKPKPIKTAGGIYYLGCAGEFYAEEISKKRFAIYHPGSTFVSVENAFVATDQNGIEVLHLPADLKLWRLPSSNIPLDVTFDDVFPEVRAYIADHWDYQDERAYDVFATWIIASWVPELFSQVPNLFFHSAIEGVGKTRGLKIIRALGRRAPYFLSLRSAPLFRIDELYHPTMLIEESEYLTAEDKGDLIGLLNSRYTQDGCVPRMGGPNNDELRLFHVFGFSAFAGTRQFLRTLMSRCIMFQMTPSSRHLPKRLDMVRARKIRNLLLGFRFATLAKYSQQIAALQDVFSDEEEAKEVGEGNRAKDVMTEIVLKMKERRVEATIDIPPRLEEIYEPLLVVSEDNEDVQLKIFQFMLETAEDKTEENESTLDGLVFEFLKEIHNEQLTDTGNGSPDLIYLRDIASRVNEDKAEKEDRVAEKAIGKSVRGLGLKIKSAGKQRRAAAVYRESIMKRLEGRFEKVKRIQTKLNNQGVSGEPSLPSTLLSEFKMVEGKIEGEPSPTK